MVRSIELSILVFYAFIHENTSVIREVVRSSFGDAIADA
jgi:hypothetical protein